MKSKKRILSIIFVFVMAFAMAATACGKKEEAAEKEETKQEETLDTEEAGVDDKNDAEAADEEETANKEKKTGDDTLTEEDIQSLKDSIRDTVISEYLEPNNISVEDFAWPDKDSGEWGYMVELTTVYNIALLNGEEMDISNADSSPYSNPEIIEATFNGIIYWLDKQGKYDDRYMKNVFSAVFPYNEVIPTIDFAAK